MKITAVGLDGVTPIDINNGSNVYTEPLFTVMGKTTPVAPTPLAISAANYERNAGATTVRVMADGSSAATAVATLTVGATTTSMTHDVTRFYTGVGVTGALPATISVTATDPSAANVPNVKTATLADQVTIGLAQANCTGTGATKACTLTVNAASSDDGSGGVAPVLTVQHSGTPLVNGAATIANKALPAYVVVSSSAGGIAAKPVTVVNQ
ncbi:MAG: hypothetical protein RIQ60_980 [Pseudomonadota bacterium]